MYAKSILAILPFLATIKAVEFNTRIKTELFSPDDLCLTLTSRKVKAGEEVHLSKCLDDSDANSKYQKWSGPHCCTQ
ncbi:hypothetical protein I302_106221 [Kwoniella bestiolae CBS 10118]|uniref:Ricin B lectin domain-containing protein n=1 Tax=Kwoniella bestiolae CBS 10118 TaxID=1296100 RepID=A0A1B9G3D5_9TREE|nr:hypothetical protein I302_05346 [Kwoniella bestiolae CBS 10118]OCF25526.1 hypothetical protein I302_05346 [Kwoniella bestiolae CBS 10118]